MRKMFYFLTIFFLLSACGTKGTPLSGNESSLPPFEVEVKEGDFVYRLYSEKKQYKEFEDFAVYAELTYVGDKDSIFIYHAASPFYFPIEELTRGYEIGYAMNEPLIQTELRKNEPLIAKYQFAGGYDGDEKSAYTDFVKKIINKGFPEGSYIIHGSAQFTTEAPPGVEKVDNFNLQGDIGIKVVK